MTSEPQQSTFEPRERPRSPKMAELVADDIRRRIADGELADGSTLPRESVLTDHYQVSRPTLREAMRVLESEALIEPRRGSREGALVRAPSIEVAARYASQLLQYRGATYGDLYQLRLILEPPAASMIAATRRPEVLDRLREAYEAEEEALDNDAEFFRRSAHFHELVVELAGLVPLTVFVEMTADLLERQHSRSDRVDASAASKATRLRRAHRAHKRFLSIIEGGEGPEAEQFWRDHLEAIGKYYQQGSTTRVDIISSH